MVSIREWGECYHLLNPVSLVEEHHGWGNDLFRGDLMMFWFAYATWFRSLSPRAAKLTMSRNTEQIHSIKFLINITNCWQIMALMLPFHHRRPWPYLYQNHDLATPDFILVLRHSWLIPCESQIDCCWPWTITILLELNLFFFLKAPLCMGIKICCLNVMLLSVLIYIVLVWIWSVRESSAMVKLSALVVMY